MTRFSRSVLALLTLAPACGGTRTRTVAGGAITSAVDWQGKSLRTAGLVATSLPTFIRVAAAPESVSIAIP